MIDSVFTRATCIRNALELKGHYCELHTQSLLIARIGVVY